MTAQLPPTRQEDPGTTPPGDEVAPAQRLRDFFRIPRGLRTIKPANDNPIPPARLVRKALVWGVPVLAAAILLFAMSGAFGL